MITTVALSGVLALGLVAEASAEPERGGTLIIGVEGEPATATAHLATDTTALMVASNIFNGLIGLDLDFNPTPDLAESWTVSEDGLVYTFALAEDATWHDGQPVTAEDVEYTFNTIIAEYHPRAGSWWPNVESAVALDDHTFEITLKEPYAPFMTLLGNILGSGTLIMPKHVYENADPRTAAANTAPIGSGAFKFKDWVPGSHIELVRNENYFKDGLPYLDRIIVQFVPDAAARLVAFERGELDFLHWYIVPHDQVGRLRADPNFEIVEIGGEAAATNEFLLFNTRNEHLSDVRVRQALAYGIDREAVRETALFGEGKTATSHISSGLGWVQTPEFDYPYDPEKANQLLNEAGFERDANGERFPLRIVWSSGREYEGRAAEVIRDQLGALGITATIETYDRPTFIERVFRQWDFDLAHQLFTTGPDPTLSVPSRYHTDQIQKAPFVNAMGYSNPELDALFDQEFKIQNRDKRRDAWIEIQRILMRDLPALPLFEIPVVNAVSARFADVITAPYGYIQTREQTHLVQ